MFKLRLVFLVGIAIVSSAQTQSPRKPPATLDGKELYVAYCASCHGMDAKGKGPVASALKNPVPDLTLISKRRNGKFPVSDLEKMILGETSIKPIHGTNEMPVWGPVFQKVENDQDVGLVRVRRVVEYLKSLQAR